MDDYVEGKICKCSGGKLAGTTECYNCRMVSKAKLNRKTSAAKNGLKASISKQRFRIKQNIKVASAVLDSRAGFEAVEAATAQLASNASECVPLMSRFGNNPALTAVATAADQINAALNEFAYNSPAAQTAPQASLISPAFASQANLYSPAFAFSAQPAQPPPQAPAQVDQNAIGFSAQPAQAPAPANESAIVAVLHNMDFSS